MAPIEAAPWGLVQVDESRWLHMTGPVAIVEARQASDVASAIHEAETLARSRGWYALGFVAYEAAAAFGLAVHAPRVDLPLVWFALFDPSAVRSVKAIGPGAPYQLDSLGAAISRERFLADLGEIREHIAAGDTYQVNYTFPLSGVCRGDAQRLAADLAAAQRGLYGAFLALPAHAICSASPELFFLREEGRITARPMKGTIGRGRTPEEDAAAAGTLQRSAKERAENVMVVDMVRNDLGRIAAIGSVEVPSLFAIERYPNVWQMTSTVTARATAPLDEIFAALFPSASVTGAPKVRTMEIIRALERRPRGVYTGAIGWIAPDGRAAFNVAIRTALVDRRDDALEFAVGSGVVWDSSPEREYEECLLKASVLTPGPIGFELLETIRWTPAEGFALLDRHLARLLASARYFSFACDLDRVREALRLAVGPAASPLRVRLLVKGDGSVRVEQSPLDDSPGTLRVALAADPIDPSDVFLFHKTTNRGVYERARRAGYDEVVLWNPQREVTEAMTANLVVEMGGRLVTPPVGCGLLPGTLRAKLIDAGEIVEAPVTIDALLAAPRVWLINSVRGWRPAEVAGVA